MPYDSLPVPWFSLAVEAHYLFIYYSLLFLHVFADYWHQWYVLINPWMQKAKTPHITCIGDYHGGPGTIRHLGNRIRLIIAALERNDLHMLASYSIVIWFFVSSQVNFVAVQDSLFIRRLFSAAGFKSKSEFDHVVIFVSSNARGVREMEQRVVYDDAWIICRHQRYFDVIRLANNCNFYKRRVQCSVKIIWPKSIYVAIYYGQGNIQVQCEKRQFNISFILSTVAKNNNFSKASLTTSFSMLILMQAKRDFFLQPLGF